MKNFVVYDNDGNILRWGISAVNNIEPQAMPGEKVVAVNRLENKFDLINKVSNPTRLSPTVVKKVIGSKN